MALGLGCSSEDLIRPRRNSWFEDRLVSTLTVLILLWLRVNGCFVAALFVFVAENFVVSVVPFLLALNVFFF